MLGRTITHFKVIEKIGAGGMGVVDRAEDLKLGRPVALKFPPAELVSDPDRRERFLREARTQAALGGHEKALDWLEKAAEERSVELLWIILDPRLDEPRSLPRFQEVCRRTGFAGA